MNSQALTDTQIIARAISHYVKNGHTQPLKDIFVDVVKRTFNTRKRGWRVFFVFESPNSFGHAGITYEVDEDGDISIYESM